MAVRDVKILYVLKGINYKLDIFIIVYLKKSLSNTVIFKLCIRTGRFDLLKDFRKTLVVSVRKEYGSCLRT